jgi:uncharacterized membrane protein
MGPPADVRAPPMPAQGSVRECLQAWVHAADAAERARCGLPTRAKKKETTMSQMTSFVKAEKAAEKASVLVAMAVVTARKAQAPTGSGSSTSPAASKRVCVCVFVGGWWGGGGGGVCVGVCVWVWGGGGGSRWGQTGLSGTEWVQANTL